MHRNKTYTKTKSITDFIYDEAQRRAELLPVFNNSHRKKAANQIGCLGEVIAEEWMREKGITYIPELDQTTHDYKISNNLTLDVKTKDRTIKPKLVYDNSAPLYNHSHQKPDHFLFISLERDKNNKSDDISRFHTAYIVGSISYEELDLIGIPFLKNETDWRNGTKFWTDCLNVEMWQLVPLKETVEIFKMLRLKPSTNAAINNTIVTEMTTRIKNGKLSNRKLPA